MREQDVHEQESANFGETISDDPTGTGGRPGDMGGAGGSPADPASDPGLGSDAGVGATGFNDGQGTGLDPADEPNRY